MKGGITRVIAVLILFTFAGQANASVTIYPNTQPTWPNGAQAAECSFTYPTLQPLSQQRTLLADNTLANGTVLYAWDYDDFAPDFYAFCNERATYNQNGSDLWIDRLDVNQLNTTLLPGSRVWPTNNPGVVLKLYFKVTARGGYNTGIPSRPISTTGSWMLGGGIGEELSVPIELTSTAYSVAYMYSVVSGTAPNYQSKFFAAAHHIKYSVRGELIKVGNINTTGNLSISTGTFVHAFFTENLLVGQMTISPATILGSGGITFVRPSCRLRGATDYMINLGRWVAVGAGSLNTGVSLPAYGDIKPIDIAIECNGALNNVYFNFQDTGASPLTNRNISVYDAVGGQKIDGLEIEMSYNNTRLNVYKISENATTSAYRVNTGAHGTANINPSDPGFQSQSSAQFSARFVQRSAIRRGGLPYTGPVTGQVNMFVTYQ